MHIARLLLVAASAIFLFACAPAVHVGGHALERSRLLSDRLEILIPKELRAMTETEWELMHSRIRMPGAVYTAAEEDVMLTINHCEEIRSLDSITKVREFYTNYYEDLLPDVFWIRNHEYEQEGREYALLDLHVRALDVDARYISLYTVLQDRLLEISFRIPWEQQDEWLEAAEAVLQSVHIRE